MRHFEQKKLQYTDFWEKAIVTREKNALKHFIETEIMIVPVSATEADSDCTWLDGSDFIPGTLFHPREISAIINHHNNSMESSQSCVHSGKLCAN